PCSAEPVEVSLPEPALHIAAGGYETCAQVQDGGVYCWDVSAGSSSPVAVTPIEGAESVHPGYARRCAIPHDHHPLCGTAMQGPSPVAGFDRVVKIARGWYHTCARTEEGSVVCFGLNGEYELGDGTTLYADQP